MAFEHLLQEAAYNAARECRAISKETCAHLDRELVRETYGAESEAAFKAILYGELRKLVDSPTELSLEPLKVYYNADIAYCKGGLTWKEDGSQVHLVEVKIAAKQQTREQIYKKNADALESDIGHLHEVKKILKGAHLEVVAAFIDYDAGLYVPRLGKLRPKIEAQLRELGADLSGITLILC